MDYFYFYFSMSMFLPLGFVSVFPPTCLFCKVMNKASVLYMESKITTGVGRVLLRKYENTRIL